MTIIVGQNPGSGRSIKTLHQWTNQIGLESFEFTNATHIKGDVKLSDANIEDLKEKCQGHDKVVALGQYASCALRKAGVEHFQMPHPSGLNRQLNNKDFVEMKLNEFKNYINATV